MNKRTFTISPFQSNNSNGTVCNSTGNGVCGDDGCGGGGDGGGAGGGSGLQPGDWTCGSCKEVLLELPACSVLVTLCDPCVQGSHLGRPYSQKFFFK